MWTFRRFLFLMVKLLNRRPFLSCQRASRQCCVGVWDNDEHRSAARQSCARSSQKQARAAKFAFKSSARNGQGAMRRIHTRRDTTAAGCHMAWPTKRSELRWTRWKWKTRTLHGMRVNERSSRRWSATWRTMKNSRCELKSWSTTCSTLEKTSVSQSGFCKARKGEARKQGPGRRGEQEARRHHANGNCKKWTPRNHRTKTEVEVRSTQRK